MLDDPDASIASHVYAALRDDRFGDDRVFTCQDVFMAAGLNKVEGVNLDKVSSAISATLHRCAEKGYIRRCNATRPYQFVRLAWPTEPVRKMPRDVKRNRGATSEPTFLPPGEPPTSPWALPVVEGTPGPADFKVAIDFVYEKFDEIITKLEYAEALYQAALKAAELSDEEIVRLVRERMLRK